MNSRIRFPFNIFFLNPVYVAARSLRSNYKKALPKYVQQKQCFSPTQSPSELKYASSSNIILANIRSNRMKPRCLIQVALVLFKSAWFVVGSAAVRMYADLYVAQKG